jgi:hypothetical protein
LDTLKRCLTIVDLKKQLKALPKTLDETYDQILLRIDDSYRDKAFRVLQFLAFAACPVIFAEAAEILTIDLDRECYDPDRKLLNPGDLMLLCSTLVTRALISEADFKDVMTRTVYYEYRVIHGGLLDDTTRTPLSQRLPAIRPNQIESIILLRPRNENGE